ncbi:hypothetical protein HK104_009220 [Borealophlyctis nickersoniae]|nr:hypothetical protein HK104_009220 [Borealophlyctis nickersoniae]
MSAPAPDMSPAAVIGTNYCGLLMTCTAFGSCLPSFLSIRDIQLKVSIALFFIFFIVAEVTNSLSFYALAQGNLVNFGRLTITCSVTFHTAFICQSFYSLRRTCMIYNLSPHVQLYLPIFMTICQCAVQYTNSAYWSMDMLVYYGSTVSPQTARSTIISIVWILSTEPVYFALLQYKIVKSATTFQRGHKNRLSTTIWLWVEAAMRLTFYVFTVLFCYLAFSDFLKPGQLAYWSMISVLPANIGLIFLTDVGRFQKALGKRDDGINANDFRTELVESATRSSGAKKTSYRMDRSEEASGW